MSGGTPVRTQADICVTVLWFLFRFTSFYILCASVGPWGGGVASFRSGDKNKSKMTVYS